MIGVLNRKSVDVYEKPILVYRYEHAIALRRHNLYSVV
jgi:hypothetical protein